MQGLRVLGLVDVDELLDGTVELLGEMGETEVVEIHDDDVLVCAAAQLLRQLDLGVVHPLHRLDMEIKILVHGELGVELLGGNLTGAVDVDDVAVLGDTVHAVGPHADELLAARVRRRGDLVDLDSEASEKTRKGYIRRRTMSVEIKERN